MQIVEPCFCPNTRLLLKHSGALHGKSQVTVCQREGIYNYLSIPEIEVKTTAPKGFLDNKASKKHRIYLDNTSQSNTVRPKVTILSLAVCTFSHCPNVPGTISLKRLMIIYCNSDWKTQVPTVAS